MSNSTFVELISALALIFTIISVIFLNATAYIFWKNRNLTLIRFRWPLSYLIWVILCDLYWMSRVGYLFGEIYGLYAYKDPSSLSIAMHCLRTIGLNGSYLIVLCRIWLFYYTYAYDRHMLESRDATSSWIIRYRNKLGNERLVLLAVLILISISAMLVVFEETKTVDIDGFTQFFFGFCFCCFIVLACFIPRHHDQLGLRAETIFYFIFGFIGFCGLLIIQFTLKEKEKRVASYLGGTIGLLLVNSISFYITMYQYDGYKHIYSTQTDLSLVNKNYLELAKIMTHSRTYDAFRKFLADIFCVENLDFVTIVQYYREYAQQNYNAEEHHNSDEDASHPNTEKRSSVVNVRRRTKTQDIMDLLVQNDTNGAKRIDIKRLKLDFAQIPNDLQKLKEISEWKSWIFHHYISNDGDHCLNLSSKLRKKYIKNYNNDQQDGNADALAFFYDEAQIEIWKLMAQDSMVHFRNSKIYKVTMWQPEDDNNEP